MSTQSAYEEILRLLPSLSSADRQSLLEELQHHVAATNSHPESLTEFQRRIDSAFGIWADRTDLPEDSRDYVRELRKGWDERSTRLQGETIDTDGSL